MKSVTKGHFTGCASVWETKTETIGAEYAIMGTNARVLMPGDIRYDVLMRVRNHSDDKFTCEGSTGSQSAREDPSPGSPDPSFEALA